MQENNIDPKVTENAEENDDISTGRTISVKRMAQLLGIGKTESYWLLNKHFFKSVQIYGHTRIDMESFNQWYDSQVKYQIAGGRPPGRLLREVSFSPKEIAEELGISEAYVYELIDKYQIPVSTFDYLKRVMKKDFYAWYNNQTRFRTKADRQRDAVLEKNTITMPEMARILGVSRNEVYKILKRKENLEYLVVVIVADRKRITKQSFENWYASQSEYKKVSERFVVDDPVRQERWRQNFESSNPEYYTIREAAEKYDIPKSNIYYWIRSGKVYSVTKDKMTLLPRRSFDLWMKQMRKEKKWHQS